MPNLEDCTRIVGRQRAACASLWNRNGDPGSVRRRAARGALEPLRAFHVDFYFAKDAGPASARGGRRRRPAGALGSFSVEGLSLLPRHSVAVPGVRARTPALPPAPATRHRDLASLPAAARRVLASVSLGRIGGQPPDREEIGCPGGKRPSTVIAEPRPEVRSIAGRRASRSRTRFAAEDARFLLDTCARHRHRRTHLAPSGRCGSPPPASLRCVRRRGGRVERVPEFDVTSLNVRSFP